MLGLKLNHVSKRGPCWRQTVICTNAGLSLNTFLGTNFSVMWINIQLVLSQKMHWTMSSSICRPFCRAVSMLILLINHREASLRQIKTADTTHKCKLYMTKVLCAFNYSSSLNHKSDSSYHHAFEIEISPRHRRTLEAFYTPEQNFIFFQSVIW